MARTVNRSEIWFYQFKKPDRLRPVLILSRQDAIEVLHTVMVAPITSTFHGAPSEVVIGIDKGLKKESAINLDHIQTVYRPSRRTEIENSVQRVGYCRWLSLMPSYKLCIAPHPSLSGTRMDPFSIHSR